MGDCWVEVWWEECGEERCEVLDVKCFLSAGDQNEGKERTSSSRLPHVRKARFPNRWGVCCGGISSIHVSSFSSNSIVFSTAYMSVRVNYTHIPIIGPTVTQ